MTSKHDKAINLHKELISRMTASYLEKEVNSCLPLSFVILSSFFITCLTCLFILSYGSSNVSIPSTRTSKGQARQSYDATKDILFVKRGIRVRVGI